MHATEVQNSTFFHIPLVILSRIWDHRILVHNTIQVGFGMQVAKTPAYLVVPISSFCCTLNIILVPNKALENLQIIILSLVHKDLVFLITKVSLHVKLMT